MIPRIALLGFSIECNRFAPPAERADFTGRCWLEGEAILADARGPAPSALAEMPGFVADMDAAGPWRPVPILLAMAELKRRIADDRAHEGELAREAHAALTALDAETKSLAQEIAGHDAGKAALAEANLAAQARLRDAEVALAQARGLGEGAMTVWLPRVPPMLFDADGRRLRLRAPEVAHAE